MKSMKFVPAPEEKIVSHFMIRSSVPQTSIPVHISWQHNSIHIPWLHNSPRIHPHLPNLDATSSPLHMKAVFSCHRLHLCRYYHRSLFCHCSADMEAVSFQVNRDVRRKVEGLIYPNTEGVYNLTVHYTYYI